MDEPKKIAPQVEAVQVTIFNQAYNLRSLSDGEHVRQIAQLVDERMRQISTQFATHDVFKIAVLAALNIADELQRMKDYYEHEQPTPPEQLPQPSGDGGESGEARGGGVVESAGREGPEGREATREREGRAGKEPESWFEAIFDSEEPRRERGERLSSQIAAKLQSLRPTSPQEPLTIEPEREKDES